MTRLGIFGGGQLGRMTALAALRMGVTCRFYDPDRPSATAGLGEWAGGRDFADADAMRRFAEGCDAVTTEWENVPREAADLVAPLAPTFPRGDVLAVCQDRWDEKTFLNRQGIPTAPFWAVDSQASLAAATREAGFPCVLKTRRMGYDGKGQFLLTSADDVAPAWAALGSVPLILEGFVRFASEVSLIAVRGRDGAMAFYPLCENRHAGGILRLTLARPSLAASPLQAQAEAHVRRLLEAFAYVGVLVVEFFVRASDGALVANEMAPRVHNSGHWTIEGTTTSQFENHARAVLGWPLGDTRAFGPFAMINFIGAIPSAFERWTEAGAWVHHYGKSYKPGRKVGHLTLRADDEAALVKRAESLLQAVAPA